MRTEQALRGFLTGVVRQGPPTQRATLAAAREAYGTWDAVAAAMGVSSRTLRRIRAGMVSPRSARLIAGLRNDPSVRAASITATAARRLTRAASRDTRVTVQGRQGPVGYGQGDYKRNRTISFDISPEFMQEIMQAFFAGDDRGAVEAFNEALMADYGNYTIVGQGWDIDPSASFTFQV